MAQLQTSTDFSVNTPSTSTSTNCPKHHHDVFISHRGPDVKNTFATSLYRRLLPHRLRPFLDKDELQKGEYIDPQIKDAISTAYIHIAIFSPGYADSTWCLDELVLIWNKFKSGDIIIPIFYNVKPSEPRWTTGRYAEALSKHERKGRCNTQSLENWRNALKDVSYIVGFELEAYNGDEDKLLEEVVGYVLKKRRKTPLHVAAHPTGLQIKVEDFEKTVLSQQQKNGKARVLGIVGLGGVGKTTLAKELFNKKSRDFKKSSFLYDVRETVRQTSLNFLQSKLLEDLTESTQQIYSIEQGIEILRERLSFLHALIVLDDVDDVDQLHAFLPIRDILHSDSLILVTSRYKNVLTSSEIAESSIYPLTGLDYQHSQQLFCSHAFLQSYPLPEFKNLVDEFCKACDGLPLSLRVFGALLSGKNQSYWNGQLDKLRQIELPDEIQKRLKISYDALDKEEERQIFLDISCYFIGEDSDMAVRIWDGSGWHGLVGLRNLQDKCLVEVGEKNTIKMHDHLRDLGRQIADQEKSSGVIPHRLWPLIEDIRGLWQQQSSVITKVRGIRTVPRFQRRFDSSFPEPSWLKCWCDEVFGNCLRKLIHPSPYRLSNLQLVATEEDDLESILRRVESPNLIWLRWNNCPYTWLPQWIPMKNIRVLEVSGNKLETLWRAESQAPLKLRELTIESSINFPKRLFKFPKSIGKLNNIEKIVVRSTGLKLIAEEFCHLRSLKYLDLHYSRCLQMLPDSFGCLINLQHLDLCYSDLRMLPNSFGNLRNLQHLNLCSSYSLKMLPDSFGNLINLQHLDLYGSDLQMLPNSFGNLIRLKYLNLGECLSLTISDETFGNICSLEYLRLPCTKVLPPQVAHQRSLEKLYLYSRHLQELPGDMGNLSSLEVFEVRSRLLKILPCSLGHLRSLKELRLIDCVELKSLPDSLGLLTQLSELFIEECGIQSLPPEMVKLNNLVSITVKSCPIRELPLKNGVEGESAAIELSRLEYLHLSDIEISEISFVDGVCPSLEHLDITWCNDLVEVGALPPTLIKLSLGNCPKLSLGDCPKLYNLTNLQELAIEECEEVEELPCLERFTSLKNFTAISCCKLKRIRGLGQLTQLQYVSVIHCDALEELANLEDLMWLKRLQVYGCPKL